MGIRWMLSVVALVPPVVLAAEPGKLTAVQAPLLDGGTLLQTLFGLALVLGLILGLGWLLKRMGRVPGAGKGDIRIVGGVALGTREKAVLLEVGDTRLLVGVAPGRVQTLHVLDGGKRLPADQFQQQLDKLGEQLGEQLHGGRA